jgi:hypothetical protein
VDDFDRPAHSLSPRLTEHCSGRRTMRSEDDLTYKLGEVIKASTNVWKSEQEVSLAHILTEYEHLLQVCVIEYTFGRALFLNVAQFCGTWLRTWTTTSLVSLRRCKSLVAR